METWNKDLTDNGYFITSQDQGIGITMEMLNHRALAITLISINNHSQASILATNQGDKKTIDKIQYQPNLIDLLPAQIPTKIVIIIKEQVPIVNHYVLK